MKAYRTRIAYSIFAATVAAPALADQFQGAYFDPDPANEQVTFAAEEVRNAAGVLQFLTAGMRRVTTPTGGGAVVHVNRFDQSGDWLQNADWQFGAPGSTSIAQSMTLQLPTDRVVLAGETNAFGSALGVFLMRLTPALGWDAPMAFLYTATAFADDPPCVSLREQQDTSLVFTARRTRGNSALDGVLIHTQPNGLPIFFRNYLDPAFPNSARISFNDVREVQDGYVVVGYIAAASTAPKSTLLLRTDVNGNFIWARVYSPIGIATESTGQGLDILPDGRITFVSRLINGGTTVGSQFIMATPVGAPVWSRNYFGFITAHAALDLDDCRQIVCAGYEQTTLAGTDRSAVTFLALDGTAVRTVAYNIPRPEITRGKDLKLTSDGGTLVAADRLVVANAPRDIHLAKGNPEASSGCKDALVFPQIDPRLPEVLVRQLSFTTEGDFTQFQPTPVFTQLGQDIYCTRCPGDLNGDGVINLTDLSALLTSFGLCEGSAGYNPNADLSDDCNTCIGLTDLSRLLAVFGTACP